MYDSNTHLVTDKIWDGFYFTYREERNGFGGYHSVDLTLRNDETGLSRKITDDDGNFTDFPGVEEGPWRGKVKCIFREKINFVFSFRKPADPDLLLEFRWMVQPDGRYFGDDDGFGMEDDDEIVLTAGMDRTGRFVTPFHE